MLRRGAENTDEIVHHTQRLRTTHTERSGESDAARWGGEKKHLQVQLKYCVRLTLHVNDWVWRVCITHTHPQGAQFD